MSNKSTTSVKLNCTLNELARMLKLDPVKLMDVKITTLEEMLARYVEMKDSTDNYEQLLKSLGLNN